MRLIDGFAHDMEYWGQLKRKRDRIEAATLEKKTVRAKAKPPRKYSPDSKGVTFLDLKSVAGQVSTAV